MPPTSFFAGKQLAAYSASVATDLVAQPVGIDARLGPSLNPIETCKHSIKFFVFNFHIQCTFRLDTDLNFNCFSYVHLTILIAIEHESTSQLSLLEKTSRLRSWRLIQGCREVRSEDRRLPRSWWRRNPERQGNWKRWLDAIPLSPTRKNPDMRYSYTEIRGWANQQITHDRELVLGCTESNLRK